MLEDNQADLLTVRELTKHYTKERAALKDVSFDLKRGELVSVIGPSGSGKSTLLRCINRMIDATSGSIVFNGQEVTHLKHKRLRMLRRKISMVVMWRNDYSHGDETNQEFYSVYPGHPSVDDFIRFYNDPQTLFSQDLPDMYTMPAGMTVN